MCQTRLKLIETESTLNIRIEECLSVSCGHHVKAHLQYEEVLPARTFLTSPLQLPQVNLDGKRQLSIAQI